MYATKFYHQKKADVGYNEIVFQTHHRNFLVLFYFYTTVFLYRQICVRKLCCVWLVVCRKAGISKFNIILVIFESSRGWIVNYISRSSRLAKLYFLKALCFPNMSQRCRFYSPFSLLLFYVLSSLFLFFHEYRPGMFFLFFVPFL